MVLVLCGQGSVVIHWHPGGRRASHVANTSRHRSQSGVGLRALGPKGRRAMPGGAAQGGPL